METNEIADAVNWIIVMVMIISLNVTIGLAGLIFLTVKFKQQLKKARKTFERDTAE